MYESVKERLGANEEGHHPAAAAAAGASATLASDALMTPCDVIKQRLQVDLCFGYVLPFRYRLLLGPLPPVFCLTTAALEKMGC